MTTYARHALKPCRLCGRRFSGKWGRPAKGTDPTVCANCHRVSAAVLAAEQADIETAEIDRLFNRAKAHNRATMHVDVTCQSSLAGL